MINTSMISELAKHVKAKIVDKSIKSEDRYHFKVKDRAGARSNIAKLLKKNKIPYLIEGTSFSSEPVVSLDLVGRRQVIIFKPLAGGMTETTLNSTITELLPCLAFLNNIKTKNHINFFRQCTQARVKTCYVQSAEIKVGEDFISKMPDSSKFKEKLKNAVAITHYLYKLDAQKSIKNVFWTYRKKPTGVHPDSPADIVVKFTDGELLGISLKAGDATTKEPLLNTYVNPIMDYFASARDKTKLREFLFKEVYSQIPGIQPNYDERNMSSTTRDILFKYETNNRATYEMLYDQMLEISRLNVMDVMTNDLDAFKTYISNKVLGVTSTPTKIVKAFGTQVKEIEDSNQLGTLLPLTQKIEAVASTTSKQNFLIRLIDGKRKRIGTMNMSIRSNAVGTNHKLGQFFSLSVKYNGLD